MKPFGWEISTVRTSPLTARGELIYTTMTGVETYIRFQLNQYGPRDHWGLRALSTEWDLLVPRPIHVVRQRPERQVGVVLPSAIRRLTR